MTKTSFSSGQFFQKTGTSGQILLSV